MEEASEQNWQNSNQVIAETYPRRCASKLMGTGEAVAEYAGTEDNIRASFAVVGNACEASPCGEGSPFTRTSFCCSKGGSCGSSVLGAWRWRRSVIRTVCGVPSSSKVVTSRASKPSGTRTMNEVYVARGVEARVCSASSKVHSDTFTLLMRTMKSPGRMRPDLSASLPGCSLDTCNGNEHVLELALCIDDSLATSNPNPNPGADELDDRLRRSLMMLEAAMVAFEMGSSESIVRCGHDVPVWLVQWVIWFGVAVTNKWNTKKNLLRNYFRKCVQGKQRRKSKHSASGMFAQYRPVNQSINPHRMVDKQRTHLSIGAAPWECSLPVMDQSAWWWWMWPRASGLPQIKHTNANLATILDWLSEGALLTCTAHATKKKERILQVITFNDPLPQHKTEQDSRLGKEEREGKERLATWTGVWRECKQNR